MHISITKKEQLLSSTEPLKFGLKRVVCNCKTQNVTSYVHNMRKDRALKFYGLIDLMFLICFKVYFFGLTVKESMMMVSPTKFTSIKIRL